MAAAMPIAAQSAMDLFYQNYKSNSEFFDLEDFIAHCAGILGGIYQELYLQHRAEMRAEKRDEIITFEPSAILTKKLKVEREEGYPFVKMDFEVMSFPYDEQGVGIQGISAIPYCPANQFERTTFNAQYQLKYVPACPVIWWFKDGEKIRLRESAIPVPKEIVIHYVPSITDPNMVVPDGYYEHVVTTAAMTIKEGGKGTVVKKSADGNPNKIPQTELDLSSLK